MRRPSKISASWTGCTGSSLIAVQLIRARETEGRVQRETGVGRGTRLVKPAQPRESGGQVEMSLGIIPIGFDRAPTPQDGLLALGQVIFCDPSFRKPHIGRHIARAQAKRVVDVSLGFLGAAGKNLAKSDEGMRVG